MIQKENNREADTTTKANILLLAAGGQFPAQSDLTITIVSWNTRELLRSCLQSIEQSNTHLNYEIHVVDNASTDGSAEMVRTEFPDVRVTVNEKNVGFAAANNQSWLTAKGRYWLLLNSDAEVKGDALDALMKFMDVHPTAGLASARLINSDGTPQHCAQAKPGIGRTLFEASRFHKLLPTRWRGRLLLGPYWTYDETIKVGWTWGTALISRRAAIAQAGVLSEKFFMYGEDLEWCLRMRQHGWQSWYCHDAEVLHHGGQSSAQQWQDAEKQKIIMDHCYQAIEMHRGALFVRVLQVATLLGLSLEWLASRLRKRTALSLMPLMHYHRQALREMLRHR